MTTGVLEEMITHQQDPKGQMMISEEEVEVEEEEVMETEEVAAEAAQELASNAMKKATWLETVKMLAKMTIEEEVEEEVAAEEVEEPASNATKRDIWPEIVLTRMKTTEKEEEDLEEEEEDAAVVMETTVVVVALESATNAMRPVTLLENVQMQAKMMEEDLDLTRDNVGMKDLLEEIMMTITVAVALEVAMPGLLLQITLIMLGATHLVMIIMLGEIHLIMKTTMMEVEVPGENLMKQEIVWLYKA